MATKSRTASPETPAISPLPVHVAIIMDGNGRWAKKRGLPRLAGHKAGTENIHRVVKTFSEYGVKYLTIYTFSTENWNRPPSEVKGLMGLLQQVVRNQTKVLHKNGVRLQHIGRLDRLPGRMGQEILDSEELTKGNQKITLVVAFDYGGRAEIVEAVKKMIAGGVQAADVDEGLVGKYLNTAGMPEPDLVIRTAGEMRLSNFLIWQTAYAEYFATPVFWPDFGPAEIEQALLAYSQRQRRFGGLEAKP